jgi:hypothetical protein
LKEFFSVILPRLTSTNAEGVLTLHSADVPIYLNPAILPNLSGANTLLEGDPGETRTRNFLVRSQVLVLGLDWRWVDAELLCCQTTCGKSVRRCWAMWRRAVTPCTASEGADGLTLGQCIDETCGPWVKANRPRSATNTLDKLNRLYGSWFAEPLFRRPPSYQSGATRDHRDCLH